MTCSNKGFCLPREAADLATYSEVQIPYIPSLSVSFFVTMLYTKGATKLFIMWIHSWYEIVPIYSYRLHGVDPIEYKEK